MKGVKFSFGLGLLIMFTAMMCGSQAVAQKVRPRKAVVTRQNVKRKRVAPAAKPEIEHHPLSAAAVGDYLFDDDLEGAYIIKNKDIVNVYDTCDCVGVVFSTNPTPKDRAFGYTHGYALAIKDASASCEWKTSQTDEEKLPDIDDTYLSYREGLTDSRQIRGDSIYPAFRAAANYRGGKHSEEISEWFLPAMAQWYEVINNLGKPDGRLAENSDKINWKNHSTRLVNNINSYLKKLGAYADLMTEYYYYWSSTEYDKNFAYYAYFLNSETRVRPGLYYKFDNLRVRAAIAF